MEDLRQVVRDNRVREVVMNTVVDTLYQTTGLGMEGSYRTIAFPGVYIELSKVRLPYPLRLACAETNEACFQMHFGLSGHEYAWLDGLHLDIWPGRHNFFFLPKGLRDRLNHDRCLDYSFFEINVSPTTLLTMLGSTPDLLRDLLHSAEAGDAALLGKASQPITPAMKQIIHQMLTCELPGELRRMYLEAKVQELFTLQLSQFLATSPSVDQSLKLSGSDTEKLDYARELIGSQLHNSHTLAELAVMVGINVDKLKKGFKTLSGTTVFGYASDLRMEQARELLLEGQQPIGEISAQVGYQNPQHFTAAFKRKYGLAPSALRKAG